MGYFFLALVSCFTLLCWVYLFTNNFAKETLETVFPAIGAIFLSLYLGYKSIVLDRPAARVFGGSIALLHDSAHGTVSGLAIRAASVLPNVSAYQGLWLIDTIPLYNDFKNLNLGTALHASPDVPGRPLQRTLENIVEYALLEWLGKSEQMPGYKSGGSTLLLSAVGSGGGVPTTLKRFPVATGASEYNPLVAERPLFLSLPAGATVTRWYRNGPNLLIKTRHSQLLISFQGHTYELIGKPFGSRTTKLHRALQLPDDPKSLGMYGFRLKFEFALFPFARYSNQAKTEAEWADTLEAHFAQDFSWERLRATLAEAS